MWTCDQHTFSIRGEKEREREREGERERETIDGLINSESDGVLIM